MHAVAKRRRVAGRSRIVTPPPIDAVMWRAGMRALRCHGSHIRRATIPGRQSLAKLEKYSPQAATWRAGMRALRCHGSHAGRATVHGRRNIAHHKLRSLYVTRRSGMTALPVHGSHVGRTPYRTSRETSSFPSRINRAKLPALRAASEPSPLVVTHRTEYRYPSGEKSLNTS